MTVSGRLDTRLSTLIQGSTICWVRFSNFLLCRSHFFICLTFFSLKFVDFYTFDFPILFLCFIYFSCLSHWVTAPVARSVIRLILHSSLYPFSRILFHIFFSNYFILYPIGFTYYLSLLNSSRILFHVCLLFSRFSCSQREDHSFCLVHHDFVRHCSGLRIPPERVHYQTNWRCVTKMFHDWGPWGLGICSMSLYLCVYLSVCLSVCVCVSVCLSACLWHQNVFIVISRYCTDVTGHREIILLNNTPPFSSHDTSHH